MHKLLVKNMKDLSWNNEDCENGKLCLANARDCFYQNTALSLKYVNQAIDYLENSKQCLCDLAQCYYIKASLLWNKDRNLSGLYFTKSIKTHILGSKRNQYKTLKFYKFVGVNIEHLDSILSTIRLIHPSGFNDPMDCPITANPNNGIPDINLFNGLRVGCFGVVNDEPYYLDASKWSYYGDFHKGICLEYNFADLNFDNDYALMDKVEYKEEYIANRGIVGSGLLTKSIAYVHENEWRIIWYDDSLTSGEYKYLEINPSMINAIYLGYKCSEDIKQRIIHFKKENPHISLYQVQPSEENFYKLSANELS